MALLLKSLGVSVGPGISAIAAETPVLQRRLFDRQDPEFPQRLLQAMEHMDELGTGYVVFEIPDGKTYIPGRKYYQVTPDRLRNMISADQQSLEEQRRLGRLEDGVE